MNSEVKDSVLSGVERFESLGAQIIEIECPRFNDGIATYYVIAPSEASANLARYDELNRLQIRRRENYWICLQKVNLRVQNEVQRRILINFVTAGYSDAY